jgi:hypothetical protein
MAGCRVSRREVAAINSDLALPAGLLDPSRVLADNVDAMLSAPFTTARPSLLADEHSRVVTLG